MHDRVRKCGAELPRVNLKFTSGLSARLPACRPTPSSLVPGVRVLAAVMRFAQNHGKLLQLLWQPLSRMSLNRGNATFRANASRSYQTFPSPKGPIILRTSGSMNIK